MLIVYTARINTTRVHQIVISSGPFLHPSPLRCPFRVICIPSRYANIIYRYTLWRIKLEHYVSLTSTITRKFTVIRIYHYKIGSEQWSPPGRRCTRWYFRSPDAGTYVVFVYPCVVYKGCTGFSFFFLTPIHRRSRYENKITLNLLGRIWGGGRRQRSRVVSSGNFFFSGWQI